MLKSTNTNFSEETLHPTGFNKITIKTENMAAWYDYEEKDKLLSRI